jgi:hypothetical protein
MAMAESSTTTIHEPLLVYFLFLFYFPNYLLLLELEVNLPSQINCVLYILMNHEMIYVENVAPDGFMMFLKGMYDMKIMGKR